MAVARALPLPTSAPAVITTSPPHPQRYQTHCNVKKTVEKLPACTLQAGSFLTLKTLSRAGKCAGRFSGFVHLFPRQEERCPVRTSSLV